MFELGRAVCAGDVAWVKTQLRQGVQVNSRDISGRTALHHACESEHKDMQRVVDVLLDAGADVNAQGEDGQTPLHVAVQRVSFQTILEKNAAGGENEETPLAISSKRNEVLVKTLLREGVQVNSRDSKGRTALHYACESEDDDIQRVVDVLLDAGAEVNAQGEDGQTPLHVAVQRVSFQTKLEKNAAGGENEETPLAISRKRNEVLVKTLLREGAMVNVRDRMMRTALHWACEDRSAAIMFSRFKKRKAPLHVVIDNYEIVKALLANITSSNKRSSQNLVDHPQDEEKVCMLDSKDEIGNTALHLACMSWSLTDDIMKCVCLLIRAGAKVGVKNYNWETVLHMAARYRRADIFDILLNNGEDVNATDKLGNTPLHMVSESGRTETVRLLLSKGAKVGVQNNTGETALHRAARHGRADIVVILLNNGEEVNATNKFGNTPLHVASESGRTETVRLLYRKGAKVGVKNNTGQTALHMAARYGRADIVNILLNNGEDVNAKDRSGDTPLHVASESGQTETVRLLYRKGAKVGVKNRSGKTPLHKAAVFAAGDIVDVLLDHGEHVSAKDINGNTPLRFLCEKAVMDNNHSQSHLSKEVIIFNINLLMIRGAKIYETCTLWKDPNELIEARRDNRMKDVETTVITQAIRVKALGLQDKYRIPLSLIFRQDLYDNLKLQCCQELESMKSTMVVKDISLYQVLSHISQSFLVSTEDLQHIDEFLSSPDLLTRFPLYGDTLRITFQRAKLLTLAVQSFYSERRKQMMKKLPCAVAEQLVNFLSNKDLRMFIESE